MSSFRGALRASLAHPLPRRGPRRERPSGPRVHL